MNGAGITGYKLMQSVHECPIDNLQGLFTPAQCSYVLSRRPYQISKQPWGCFKNLPSPCAELCSPMHRVCCSIG